MNPTNEPGLSLIDAIVYQAVGDNEVLAATIKSNIQSYINAEIARALKGVEVTIEAFDREIIPTINGGNEMVDYRSVLKIIERTRKAAERAKLKEVK